MSENLQNKRDELVKFLGKRSNLFVLEIVAVYVCWKVVHYFLIHNTGAPGQAWLNLVKYLGTQYAVVCSFLLNHVGGEKTFSQGITIFYTRTLDYIRVEDHCLAIPVTIIFTGSILLFPGKWVDKLWFIPLGIFFIIVVNILRIIFICQAFEYHSAIYFKINHSLVYVVLTYTLIMGMIIWWMKRLPPATPGHTQTTNS